MPKISTNRTWLTTDQVNVAIEAQVDEYNAIHNMCDHALAVPCAESYEQLIRFVNERDIQELTAANQGKIIVPFLKNLNHYVLLVIDQKLKTITYMDPLGHPMPVSLGAAIKQREWLFNDFDVIDEQKTQQQNGYDCGIFAILNAQQRLFDTPMPDQTMATDFRNTCPWLINTDSQATVSVADQNGPSSAHTIMETLLAYAATTKNPGKAFNALISETSAEPLPEVQSTYSQFARGPLRQMASSARAKFFERSHDEKNTLVDQLDASMAEVNASDVQALLKTKHAALGAMLDGDCSKDGFEKAFDEAAIEVAHKQALLYTKQCYSLPATSCGSDDRLADKGNDLSAALNTVPC